MAKSVNLQEVAGKMLRLEKRKTSELKQYGNNPRNIEKAIPQVAESIRQCGYITPIVIDEDNIILAGHTRYAALLQNGIEECEVIVACGLTEEQRKIYRLLDNKTGEIAKWDKEKLKEELKDLDFQGFDFGQCEVQGSDFDFADDEPARKNRVVICPRCKSEVPA